MSKYATFKGVLNSRWISESKRRARMASMVDLPLVKPDFWGLRVLSRSGYMRAKITCAKTFWNWQEYPQTVTPFISAGSLVISQITVSLLISNYYATYYLNGLVSIHQLQYTHTHSFNGPVSGTAQVSWYKKGKSNLDFTEARVSEWQWHQLGHMQVCTSLQTDNHASTPPRSFYRPDALPATQPTASKHWRHNYHQLQYSN